VIGVTDAWLLHPFDKDPRRLAWVLSLGDALVVEGSTCDVHSLISTPSPEVLAMSQTVLSHEAMETNERESFAGRAAAHATLSREGKSSSCSSRSFDGVPDTILRFDSDA
jgi:hypothetical protein